MKISRTTRVELVGRGTCSLTSSDHIATGGEGSVYGWNDLVIKLYTDGNKMRLDGMADKLTLLARTMQHPYIVAPIDLVLYQGRPVGYYMNVATGEAMPEVFTNDFRREKRFGDRQASTLVDHMREVFTFVHGQHALLVDPNELNWKVVLKGKGGVEPRVLDVDSWAIDRWPPKVIMPSIRDWHTHGISELSDWFAWAVVTFQVYTGIHPYRGSLDGYGMYALEQRMRDNASVFSPGVRLNQAVRDFGCIPGPLLGWYEATFQDGERATPPSPFDTGVTRPPRHVRKLHIVTTKHGALRRERLHDVVGDPVIRVFHCGVVQHRSGKLYDLASKRMIGATTSMICEVIPGSNGWLVGQTMPDGLSFTFIDGSSLRAEPVVYQGEGDRLVRYENRLFVVTPEGLNELKLHRFERPLLTTARTWDAMRSTTWFDGVGVQDALGAMFLIAPFGSESCKTVRVPELDGLRVVAAKAGNHFVAVIALNKMGEYQKLEFALDSTYSAYTLWQGGAQSPEQNMAILPKSHASVAATIVRDGELVIFVPSTGAVNRVADRDVATTQALANWNDLVVYIQDGQVWSLRLA
jgi:hypothetical protein